MKFYKFIPASNKSRYADFDYSRYLPLNTDLDVWQPGSWLPYVNEIKVCESGYHFTDFDHLHTWADDKLYEIEFAENQTLLNDGTKWCAHQIRLTRQYLNWDKSHIINANYELLRRALLQEELYSLPSARLVLLAYYDYYLNIIDKNYCSILINRAMHYATEAETDKLKMNDKVNFYMALLELAESDDIFAFRCLHDRLQVGGESFNHIRKLVIESMLI